ncbi:lysophospholipid acyltransferase family protein [Mycolicibacterium sp.]|uniref:lysophospholipid acyltransferase family protein n=1 Tax=Mycolicibacterium sp. TaxID=2320850 RepID=UPI0025FA21BC|nr:lysophospholipid acyltransferase family protein [Mycolicibacterium sp.]MCB9410993.1 1-acyl-sn-glycerol-3-phosphate acyltransferase [Mycolicibacterium sp.]
MTGQGRGHPWLPETTCDHHCVLSGLGEPGHLALETLRCALRITTAALVLMALPLLAIPLPGHLRIKRLYCRAMLSALGIRITLSGGPIRNLRGMLVVSNHVSWVDVFTVGAVLPGTFVARADLIDWPAVGLAARLARIIPIDRGDLRGLPAVVDAVTGRLRAGSTVVAFPEGTTYCGTDHGRFRPALFQSAIDAARPVQPVRLTYHHRDGKPSTATAFLGDDSLWASLKRTVRTPRTIVHLEVRPLELPGAARNELAARCEAAIRVSPASLRENCAGTEV